MRVLNSNVGGYRSPQGIKAIRLVVGLFSHFTCIQSCLGQSDPGRKELLGVAQSSTSIYFSTWSKMLSEMQRVFLD